MLTKLSSLELLWSKDLDRHADVEARENDGSTALMIAEEVGHTEIVQLLEEAGAKE